jgi:calcineurin-like phosphoesterase family protein
MYFFTADEHYNHNKEWLWGPRGFNNVKDHDLGMIDNHNSVVTKNDITIHAGDFAFAKKEIVYKDYVRNLNGNHIFIKGSHDRWLKSAHEIYQKNFDDNYIVVCHYCMRTWARSHYNSWHLYGHSHGRLSPIGKSWDIGVDNNEYFPVSLDEIKKIMSARPDNPNYMKGHRT